MKRRSKPSTDWDDLRARIIGLGERSIRKSHYPELEQRLGELERFRALLDQSNDLIFLVQIPSGHFADVNESACRQLDLSRAAVLEMSIGDLVPTSVSENMAALFADTDRIDQGGKTIVTAFRSNERELPVECPCGWSRSRARPMLLSCPRPPSATRRRRSVSSLRFFESMDRVNRAMQGTNDLEQ
jgi:PAS domain S-box-containing protein